MGIGLKPAPNFNITLDYYNIALQASKKSAVALNINNLFNVLPEWEFKAENPAGETLLKDAAALKLNSNLITFNQRYAITTYDGSHFS
ncbi:hypothetical protein [Haliscomenobacter hydrossis]|uniref:Uncharacterized protein n=1 Tax=Haliscomenobacter hydrossis (strain ATCC 27775 / DSM 1100 / LMG 10767 / O) TaxID=760192 RepID=F4KRG1_HALH1|nr:hypothetical protein [Haliscomenobacter hydrossis]AEE47951.1 hypothetical protein Halhy_0037 [Haliscomenobacter hydrossis DSM 1100]